MINNKEEALEILKRANNGGFVKNLVVGVAEKLLPIIFWLGLLFVAYTGYIIGDAMSYDDIKEVFYGTIMALVYIIGWIVSFYFIYLFIDIRDNLKYGNSLNETTLKFESQENS